MPPQLRPLVKKKWNLLLGREGEQRAVLYLESLGWRIISTNWRLGRYAEIDIIARDEDGVLVFVEVKTRCTQENECGFHAPGFDALTWRKQKKIVTSLKTYMEQKEDRSVRFRIDVVSVEFRVEKGIRSLDMLKSPTITHVRNAFGCGF